MDMVALSKYLSYLLRHHPDDLPFSKDGFVPLDQIVQKIKKRFPQVTKHHLLQLSHLNNSRFQIKNGNIRALYGHSIPVEICLPSAKNINVLYHGTTQQSAQQILLEGLKPKGRQKVHLSATVEEAIRVGKRRTPHPVILQVDVMKAQQAGIIFEKATDLVYLSDEIPPEFISKLR